MTRDALNSAINGLEITENLVNKFIVAPLANFGIAGFVFDIQGEESVSLTSDITDHFVETNVAIQDHISISPDVITLSGYIGELIYREEKQGKLQKVAERVVTLSSLLPEITNGAKAARNIVNSARKGKKEFFNSVVKNSADIYSAFKALNPAKTKQAQAFNYFKALRDARQLVAVNTPFKYYSSMAIQDIVFRQSEETSTFCDISVTLKEFRTVDVEFVKFDSSQFSGRTQNLVSEEDKLGKVQGETLGDGGSLLLKGFQFFGFLQ